ncbi:MAG: peptidoglycan-binding protein [bacterium]
MSKSKIAKITTGVVGAITALAMVGGVAVLPAFAADDVATQIAQLMAQIQMLQSKLGSSQSVASSATALTSNLMLGSKGAQVMSLQQILNGDADTVVALSGAGSKGNETQSFGPATKAAVIKFQKKWGITPAAGYVGAITRAKLNGLVAVTPVTPVTPGTPVVVTPGVAGSLTVTAASVQPANALVPALTSRVPFTKIVLTAGASDVIVNGVTVQRTGSSVDSVLSGIVLLDENGGQIGIAKTLNSVHQSTIGDPITIKAGTSRTLTIAGNRGASGSQGGTLIALDVVGINTSATLAGDIFPIKGAMNTINETLTVGTAPMYTSSFDPGASASKEIGTNNYKFSGVRVTAGSAEKVILKAIRWYQSGSVSSGDLANVKVVVVDGGTATYDTTISSDGKYYTTMFGNDGILIDKGLSKDIYVQADIVGSGSSGRTVKFDIYKNTDIFLAGETYGYGIVPTGGTVAPYNDNSNPYFTGYTVTITAGQASTISKAVSVPAQNVAVNVPNQTLGGFDINLKGEAITAQSMIFHITAASNASNMLLTNVSLVNQNGAVVAGPVDAVADAGSNQKVTFTDSVTFPIGVSTYTLKGKVSSATGNNATYVVNTAPATDWTNVTGQLTGNNISLAGFTTFAMNTVTVKAASMNVAVSYDVPSQTVVAGGQKLLFTNYQFDGSNSGEDVRFSSVPLTLTVTAPAVLTDLTSCQLFDGATAINSTVVNPTVAHAGAETITFDNPLTVPKGTVKTLAMKCNVSPSAVATGRYTWGVTGAQIAALSATGVTSGTTVTATGATNSGGTFTLGAGTLVASDPSTLSYKIAASGASDVVVGSLRLHPSNQDVILSELGLTLNGNLASTSDIVSAKIWDGSTQVGTVTFTGSTYTATSTISGVTLLRDTDKDLRITASLQNIGVGMPGRDGALIKVNFSGARGSGSSSGSDVWATGGTSAPGVRVFRSYPTFAALSVPSTLVAGTMDLYKFSISTPAAGNGIGLAKVALTIATSTANAVSGSTAVTNVKVYGYTDAGFSSVVPGTFTNGQIVATIPALLNGGTTIASTTAILQVPAGTTYYFKVVGDVALTSGSGTFSGSVTTKLNGDAAYPTNVTSPSFMATLDQMSADTNSDFIWSPNANGTSVSTDSDWTNGYGVSGLPSDFLQSATISK